MSRAVTKTHQTYLIHDNFGMYIFLRVLLIIFGLIVAVFFMFVAVVSTFLFGLLLLIAGIVFILQAFVSGKWSIFLLHTFGGVLLFGSGLLIMLNPSVSFAAFSLLLSLVFLAIGIAKMTAAANERDVGWGWDFTGGIAVFGIGILIWRVPISTSIGLFGLFFGLGIIATGISELLSGLQLHKSSK